MNEQTFKNQLERTYRAFKEHPKTMKQVSIETGIDRPNICRYVAFLKKRNKIAVTHKGKCPITRHHAQFFSTDPKYFKTEPQSSLFEDRGCRV